MTSLNVEPHERLSAAGIMDSGKFRVILLGMFLSGFKRGKYFAKHAELELVREGNIGYKPVGYIYNQSKVVIIF